MLAYPLGAYDQFVPQALAAEPDPVPAIAGWEFGQEVEFTANRYGVLITDTVCKDVWEIKAGVKVECLGEWGTPLGLNVTFTDDKGAYRVEAIEYKLDGKKFPRGPFTATR